MTAVSGSWWSGPYDHRGIAVADSRDGSPNGFHILSIDGSSYSTRFQPANEPNARQMRIMLESQFHRDRKELYSEFRMGQLLGSPLPQRVHSQPTSSSTSSMAGRARLSNSALAAMARSGWSGSPALTRSSRRNSHGTRRPKNPG
jgi:hypothetical protein